MVAALPPSVIDGSLDIPASVIEQIPLGVQVIDLASLRASDRPQGQSLYPDSIIPVSSFTHGQHPDTGSAQTVETDGNHALKVALASGGAGNPTPAIMLEASNLISGSGNVIYDAGVVNVYPIKTIYGYFYSCLITDWGSNASVIFQFSFYNADNGQGVYLDGRELVKANINPAGGSTVVSEKMMFPVPMDVSALFGASTNAKLRFGFVANFAISVAGQAVVFVG